MNAPKPEDVRNVRVVSLVCFFSLCQLMFVYVIDTETQRQYTGFHPAFVWGLRENFPPNFGNPPIQNFIR